MAYATILSSKPTGDGYDVRFITAGEAHVLHFVKQPGQIEIDAAITKFCEQRVNIINSGQEEGNERLYDQ